MLAPGQSISIGFGADGALNGTVGSAVFNGEAVELRFPDFQNETPVSEEMESPIEETVEPDLELYTDDSDEPGESMVDSILVQTTSSWSGGFNGEILFTNEGNETIDGWSLIIENGPAINSAWNCQWTTDGVVDQFDDDGWNGWEKYGPYDGIIIAAAAPQVPEKLLQQLGTGGTLIMPFGEKEKQELVIVYRDGDIFDYKRLGAVSFVPLIKGKK